MKVSGIKAELWAEEVAEEEGENLPRHKLLFQRMYVTLPSVQYSKHLHIRTYDFRFQADQVLIYRVLSENVLKMFLKFVSEILYMIHCQHTMFYYLHQKINFK